MAVIKQDRKFAKKYLIGNIVYCIPLVFAFLIAWNRFGTFDALFWISIGIFVLGILLGFGWDVLRLRSYYCPTCGNRIPSPTIQRRVPGDPIRYYCDACDVEWDTCLREAKDSGG
jgi:hypothetical protein